MNKAVHAMQCLCAYIIHNIPHQVNKLIMLLAVVSQSGSCHSLLHNALLWTPPVNRKLVNSNFVQNNSSIHNYSN